ncbi:MAG: hypothetical protein IJH44_03845 [Solobacterium sp.]|nr:hypothetical protein [Solobacterium sp.]MBQ6356855.1 hypothetical protein [Solobacterium sp.]
MSDVIFMVFWTIAMAIALYLAVRYLWPLLLVAVLVALGGAHRRKKAIRQMEKEYEKAREETLANQVFQQQVRKREEAPVIIDAEFTPVEEEKQEQAVHGSNN